MRLKNAFVNALGVTVMCTASAIAAQSTGKTVNAETMTCEEFLALGQDVQPNVVYYLEGYSEGGKGEAVLVEAFEEPITMVVSECKKTPKASLMSKVKNFFHRSDRNR
jgi:acid stress chaperone HdeA